MEGQHTVHLHTAARKGQRTSLCQCGGTCEGKAGMNSSLMTSWVSTSPRQTLGMDVPRQKHSSVSKWTVIDKSMYQVMHMHKNRMWNNHGLPQRNQHAKRRSVNYLQGLERKDHSEHSNSTSDLAKELLRATPYKLQNSRDFWLFMPELHQSYKIWLPKI